MTEPTFQVQPTSQGFAVTVGSQTTDFAFGQTNAAEERQAVAIDYDVIRNSSGEFRWEPKALVKLRLLGLFAGFKPDGSAKEPPNPLPFLVAAGIVEAPAAVPVVAKEEPATLEQLMLLPGANLAPDAAKQMAASGVALSSAREIFGEVLRSHVSNNPNRTCNAEVGLIFNRAEL